MKRTYIQNVKQFLKKNKKPKEAQDKFLHKTGYKNRQKSCVKVPNCISHVKNANLNLHTSIHPNRITHTHKKNGTIQSDKIFAETCSQRQETETLVCLVGVKPMQPPGKTGLLYES